MIPPGSDEYGPIAHTPPNPSPPEPGARSTAVLLNGWNEITEVSGVEHDAARGQLTIASDAPFAHHDRTGSLRLDPVPQVGGRTGALA
jgi:hypothetical protein